MRSTAKPTQPTAILYETRHGFRILRWFRAANGSNRLCGTQQGWMVEHARVTDRYTFATGWRETLADARRDIDEVHTLAHDLTKADELFVRMSPNAIEQLARMFPDAPNPAAVLKRIETRRVLGEQQKAEREAAEAKAKKLADAAPAMLAALRAAFPVLKDEANKHPAPEWDAIVRSFREAITQATGAQP